ncbi:MAG: enoyl-CoA hydratase/isomerase family protein [Lautropia sp.]
MGSPVRIERAGRTLCLTLARPEAANALDEASHRALVAALSAAVTDAGVGAVVLRADGDRSFCAGVDLKEFAELAPAEASERRRELLRQTLLALIDCDKPVIAVARGAAIGAGCMVAMLADQVIAGEQARFSLPEVRIGIPTPVAISVVAGRHGSKLASSLVLSARVLDARDALHAGVVDAVVAGDALDAAAIERAGTLGGFDSNAFRATKRWANRSLHCAVAAAFDEAAALARVGST